MFAGIPPVVFPYGGVGHLVVNNYTGLLVQSEKEYSHALEYLYHNPDERKRLGENAREYAKQIFGGENAAKKFVEVYAHMMASEKKKPNWKTSSIHDKVIKESPNGLDLTGSNRFIESLGKHADVFVRSRNSKDLNDMLKADEEIAQSTPVMVDGGIFSYARYYPNDPFLRLWHGLALYNANKPQEALAELAAAMNLGCDRFYILYYIAQAALKSGNVTLAREALSKVKAVAPEFAPASNLLQAMAKEVTIPPEARLNQIDSIV